MGGDGGNLKHVVHKRVHLERPQPVKRRKLGYLEKHKDYVRRAKDFHRKEDQIQKLQRKAYFKNEDEFTFAMQSHKQEKGKMEKKNQHLTLEELKLVDSQDKRYVAMREQADRKSAQRRAEALHFLDAERPNKHVLFVDEDDDAGAAAAGARKRRKLKDFDVAAHFDTHPALLKRKANRLRLDQLQTASFADSQAVEQGTRAAYRELLQRQERSKKLGRVREELEQRQHLREKGRRMKIADAKGDRPAEYKWFAERKR
eukprot:TRINITY_DN55207_c0_g1_i1.p1 TRINITY_DN55207_c0_g1~~TRINITY_DN55207_c0_g1_i1.p1  ORF type:complete len:278 (-),score=64.33 TRINITY_DN55207_c0_g1_i1:85-858(-)